MGFLYFYLINENRITKFCQFLTSKIDFESTILALFQQPSTMEGIFKSFFFEILCNKTCFFRTPTFENLQPNWYHLQSFIHLCQKIYRRYFIFLYIGDRNLLQFSINQDPFFQLNDDKTVLKAEFLLNRNPSYMIINAYIPSFSIMVMTIVPLYLRQSCICQVL